jgi:hypothetical protein
MATTTVVADSTVYTLLSAATDVFVQNISAYPIRLCFKGSLPTPADTNYHTLQAGEAVQKVNDTPSESLYVRSHKEGRNCKVTYSL